MSKGRSPAPVNCSYETPEPGTMMPGSEQLPPLHVPAFQSGCVVAGLVASVTTLNAQIYQSDELLMIVNVPVDPVIDSMKTKSLVSIARRA